jgi:arylsulfatase A-like enzyme/Flp pilus assembly protein TadD
MHSRKTICMLHVAFCISTVAACRPRATDDTTRPIRPNILLITIDTLRADRVGAGITPAIDRLAASGVRFTAARTAAPLTLPSHTTIMTGLWPPAHGVRENGIDRLTDRHRTVARRLKNAGYQTAAFVGAFVLDRRFGLAQGFDTYDDQIPRDPAASDRLEAERPASAVIDRALAWLDRASPPDPFFVWIHLYDPHAPYTPPAEFLERARRVAVTSHQPPATSAQPPATETSLRYDGEVMYADAQIARVVDWLDSHHLAGRTLVIIAGDHGEGLGEHEERTHGMLLYDSTLRVPLVVVEPSRRAARRDDPVTLADVAPTILRTAGVKPPPEMKGRDLFDEVRLKPDPTKNVSTKNGSTADDVYAETEYPRSAGWSPLQALTDGRWKMIRSGSSAAASELYDLQTDAAEQRDVAAAQPGIARGMSSRIDAIRASAAPSAARIVSDEAAERLRALGYVARSSSAAPAPGAPNPRTTIAAWNEFEDALAALAAKQPRAVSMLERLAATHPEAPVFQSTYARALRDAGQTRKALATYRLAARRWPTDATLFHDLAVAAREAALATHDRALGGEAERAERTALALAPESAAAHNGLGLLAVEAGRPREAADEFERATALDPNNASYWTNPGNARRSEGDRARAEQAYRQALTIDGNAVDALNGLGVLLVETNRAGEATRWFEQAIAASPDFVEARLNLGIALQQSGQPARASEVYRAVLESPGRHTREKEAAAKLLAALGASR